MAIIYSYPPIGDLSGSDTILVNDTSKDNSTKTASIDDIKSYVDGGSINDANLKFKWNTRDTAYRVNSTRTGINYSGLYYSKLHITFENLVLENGSTYGLLIERFKPRTTAASGATPVVDVPSGFKRMSNNGAVAPFDQRVFELPITTTTGQYFDFKFDLYYSSGAFGFPLPSGFSGKGPGRSTSTQYLAFRIVKRTNAIEEISSIVAKLRMIGVKGQSAASTVPVITFGTY